MTHAHEFKVKKFHDCLFSVRPSWQLVCLDLMNSELTDDFVVKKGRGFPAVFGHCATNTRNSQEQLVTHFSFFCIGHWQTLLQHAVQTCQSSGESRDRQMVTDQNLLAMRGHVEHLCFQMLLFE